MSEWLTKQGRQAAKLLGPIKTNQYCRIVISGDKWRFQIGDGKDWEDSAATTMLIGEALQNEHARKKLAERKVRVVPDGLGVWYWTNGTLTSSSFRSYEGAIIGAVLGGRS